MNATWAYEMFGTTLFVWLYFASVCIIGSRPGAARNQWAGIRIPATMASDEAWGAGHRAAMWHVRLGALSIVPVAVITIVFVGSATQLVGWIKTVLLAATVAWMLGATHAASRAAQAVQP